ncbi:MAG TPA: cytochrome C oxidase subunit IV family protein [Thermoanaerobaculia bacterium]|nr:cytochrome C oxidase subunit IV family protein [Thermoanaerobaculia bacterium]
MTEHVAHEHEHHDHGHDNSPEAIRKEIRKYLYVFGGLAILTIITVAISQLHLPTWQAVVLALAVATVKGSLVAAFFMHLVTERKLIYAVLLLTVFFFGVLMWGPWHHRDNAEKVWPGYDVNASKPAPKTPTEPQGSGH